MKSAQEIMNEATSQIHNGNAAEAIKKLQHALILNPSEQNALYFISLSYRIIADPVSAMLFAKRVLAIGNISENSRNDVKRVSYWAVDYARQLIEDKKYISAWSICHSAFEIDQNNIHAVLCISYCEAATGNPLRAMRRIPNNPPVTKEVTETCNLGIVESNKMLERDNMEGFSSLISEVIRIFPGNEGFHKKLHQAMSSILTKAIEFHQSGFLEKAEAYYDFILSKNIDERLTEQVNFLKSLIDRRKNSENLFNFLKLNLINRSDVPRILTINIPTYNRGIKALFQLENVFFQIVENKLDNVSIQVMDNCSTDNTEHLIKSFILEHDPYEKTIKYKKNPKNIGFDGNIVSCFNQSDSDYVWFLADDDYADHMSIQRIVEFLKKTKSTLIFLGKSSANGSFLDQLAIMTPHENPISLSSEKELSVSKDDEDTRAALSAHCTWVSSFIVKKSIPAVPSGSFGGTAAAHIGIVSMALHADDNPSVTYLGYPLVKNFPHTIFSKNFLEYFVSGLVKVFETPELGYSKETAKRVGRASMPFIDNFIYSDRSDMRTSYRFRPLYLIRKKIEYGFPWEEIVKFAPAVIRKYMKDRLSAFSHKEENAKDALKQTNI